MEDSDITIPFIHADRTPMSKQDRKDRTEIHFRKLCALVTCVKTHHMGLTMPCIRPSLELFKLWSRDWKEPFYAGKPFYNGWTEIMDKMWEDLADNITEEDYVHMEPDTVEKLLVDATIEYATLSEERHRRKEQKRMNRVSCLNSFFMIGLSIILAVNVYGFYTR